MARINDSTNIKKFETEMLKYDKEHTFFIATDSKNVQNY